MFKNRTSLVNKIRNKSVLWLIRSASPKQGALELAEKANRPDASYGHVWLANVVHRKLWRLPRWWIPRLICSYGNGNIIASTNKAEYPNKRWVTNENSGVEGMCVGFDKTGKSTDSIKDDRYNDPEFIDVEVAWVANANAGKSIG